MTKYMTRKVSRETLVESWGLPYGFDGEIEVRILDNIDQGSGRWESHHGVVFVAPDDGLTYMADYSQGLTEYQDQRPWEDDKEVVITRVEPVQRVITVTDWNYVPETPVPAGPKVPTKAELLKTWKQNRADDEFEWNEATW